MVVGHRLHPSRSMSINEAANNGNIKAVKQHLAAGTDVDSRNNHINTPLMNAAYEGHKEIVELLINNGADVSAKTHIGQTALWWAVNHPASGNVRRKEIVELLLAKGADVNAKEIVFGQTPLIMALGWSSCDIDIVELLIAKGADVNAQERDGTTPLSTAVDEAYSGPAMKTNPADHIKIIELLLAKGAKVNIKDDDGETLLDMVIFRGQKEITDLLRKHGGKTGEELKATGK